MVVRAIPGPVQTHLDGAATSITHLWRITWTDGTVFRLTSHDRDIPYLGEIYEGGAVGFDRSDVSNSATLAVDSMDVSGFFDNEKITEEDLRGGCFDHAAVRLFEVNWRAPADGEIKLRRGWLGEVFFDEQSQTYRTELRGLTQAFSQNIIEKYARQCRYDYGDGRCNRDDLAPVNPPDIAPSTAYAVGDVVKARQPVADIVSIHAPGVVDDDDDSQFAATGTTGSDAAAADTNKLKNLAGNFRFQPVGGPSQNPSNSFVSWPDAAQYTLGLDPFTIEFWFNADALNLTSSPNGPCLASQFTSTGNQRSWFLGILESTVTSGLDGLQLIAYDGTSQLGRLNVPLEEFTPYINQWYHVAITRDKKYRLRIFVDGVLRATASFPFDIFNSTANIRLGMFDNVAANNRHFEGSIEDFRIVVGDAVYVEAFTPPGALPSTFADTLTLRSDYEDTNYRVITANTTGGANVANFPTVLTKGETLATTIDVDDNNTISRPAGSFLDDGWEIDMVYRSTGFTDGANNGVFRISAVTASTMDLVTSSLVAESGTGDEVLTHIAWDGGVEFSVENAKTWAGEIAFIDSRSAVVIGPPGLEPADGLIKLPINLVNGDAEFGDLTGWTVNLGVVVMETTNPDTGDFAFFMSSDNADARMNQTLNVAAFDSQIDGGGQTITINWRHGFSNNVDQLRMEFDFLDSSDVSISTHIGAFDIVQAGFYESRSEGPVAIPVNTRKIVVEVFSDRRTSGNHPKVDNMVVTTTLVDTTLFDDDFNYGVLNGETGLNGGKSFEIKDFDVATKTFTLFLKAPFAWTVGDQVSMSFGCNRELSDCIRLLNSINHGGFPNIIGDDAFLRYPDAPSR